MDGLLAGYGSDNESNSSRSSSCNRAAPADARKAVKLDLPSEVRSLFEHSAYDPNNERKRVESAKPANPHGYVRICAMHVRKRNMRIEAQRVTLLRCAVCCVQFYKRHSA
jgi:hypothetical protein